MISFRVVKEQHGWSIRTGLGMSTPFWSKALAIREAACLAASIRCHGECTEVIIEDADRNEPPIGIKGVSSSPLEAILTGTLGNPVMTESFLGTLKVS